MRATLIIHHPPKFEETGEATNARLNEKIAKVAKALGAETTDVRGGAGWNFEVHFS